MLYILAVSLPCSAPDVVDWSERHMDISWKEPVDNGGAPITGYHVEAKARGDEAWQLWETVDTNRTMASMQKLQKGREYQFRVIAINKAGKSEVSHASRPKVAKDQHCKFLCFYCRWINVRFNVKSHLSSTFSNS